MMQIERLFSSEVFGERLRLCRKARDLNQQDLAKQMHIAQGWISELENGKQTRLEAETVFRFALALNVSADYLLGLSAEMERATPTPTRHPRRKRATPATAAAAAEALVGAEEAVR